MNRERNDPRPRTRRPVVGFFDVSVRLQEIFMQVRFLLTAGALIIPAALASFAIRSPAQTLRTPPEPGTLQKGSNLRNPPAPATPPVVGLPDQAQVAELVLANHILADEGVLDAYGHVSVRDERNPDHFLLARQIPAGVVTTADILEYDLDTKPVRDTGAVGYSERFIHGEIYKARPDVKAVIHFHAPELISFGVTGVPLRPMIHMAGFLPQQVPIFEIRKFGYKDLLIRNNEMGHALAMTLGNSPTVLMRGHGAVVVAPSLHVVTGRAYYMMINARTQLEAMATGRKVNYMTAEEAETVANQDGFERAWTLWAEKEKAAK
jgi:HCOMODA/2-hydroxy-3-carboxy-muconic semialdehyde decarboxylase